jgi:hypothetical protein
MEPLTEEQLDLLYRFWNGTASPDERTQAESLLTQQPALRELEDELSAMNYMITARGIEEIVREHHRANLAMAEQPAASVAVRSLVRPLLRIAAAVALLVMLAGAGSWMLNVHRFYSQHDLPYELPVARGSEEKNLMDSCYRIRQTECVLSVFQSIESPAAKELFLAGVASLQSNDAAGAVILFERLQSLNRASANPSFREEGEYYLALAYLKSDKVDEAESIFRKIHDDRSHLYHRAVSSWDLLWLRFLAWD